MLELLFLALGIAVGYNIRHDRQTHQENLVLEKVDTKLRQQLAVAVNLNESLLSDLAELKRAQSGTGASAPVPTRRTTAHELPHRPPTPSQN